MPSRRQDPRQGFGNCKPAAESSTRIGKQLAEPASRYPVETLPYYDACRMFPTGPVPGVYTHSLVTEMALRQHSSPFSPARAKAASTSSIMSFGGSPTS